MNLHKKLAELEKISVQEIILQLLALAQIIITTVTVVMVLDSGMRNNLMLANAVLAGMMIATVLSGISIIIKNQRIQTYLAIKNTIVEDVEEESKEELKEEIKEENNVDSSEE